jgi:hypothetical protein
VLKLEYFCGSSTCSRFSNFAHFSVVFVFNLEYIRGSSMCAAALAIWRIFHCRLCVDDKNIKKGEETEINLKQFSRKVEIKGFNRERIEKERGSAKGEREKLFEKKILN